MRLRVDRSSVVVCLVSDWKNRSIRVEKLLERLRDRLSPESYKWAVENADHVEWEIAVHVIREAQECGDLKTDVTGAIP